MAKKQSIKQSQQMTRWAQKHNDSLFKKDYKQVLIHIQYAAHGGLYHWEENCNGWPRYSKTEYIIKSLIKDGFSAYENGQDIIVIDWY
jgi:hypothetical protein